MSFFTFNIIGNAVDAYQQATNVTSDNIANVATPGASRQSATISEAIPISGSPYYSSHIGGPGTRGEGAVVDQIERIHQDSYDTLFRGASSSQYFYTTEQQQLGTLQSGFGEPSNGVNAAYAALQTAISNVATAPTSVAVRQTVLAQAQTFATTLNTASAAIAQQQSTIMLQAAGTVDKVNGFLDTIAALNGRIRALRAVGDNPNTYLDQRDYAIDQLSGLISTTTSLQANGSSLVSVNGSPLVNDTIAYHLAPPVVGTAADGTRPFVVGMADDPNANNPKPVALGSGELGAFADVFNTKLVPYGQQLDNFASSAATEINRITQAAVDLNGDAGTALFEKPPNQQPVTAANIAVAIDDPTAVPVALISTAAGTLTQPLNSANNTISTSDPLTANVQLHNPPAAALSGTLSIGVDGVTQTFAYSTAAGGNADSIGDFMTNFNAKQLGITVSFDTSTQRITFARDPNNIDAIHRGLQGQNAPTPGFTITDSLGPAGTTPSSPPTAQGAAATGLLQALGATNINGIAQTAINAFGSSDNGAANSLLKLFGQNVGVGALQTSAAALSSAGPGHVTITQPPGSPGAFAALIVGQVVTILNATTGTQQNVPITAIDRTAGTITVNASAPIAVNDPISTVQSQTLGAAYQGLITQMGLDMSTAKVGASTQGTLAASIEQARQSVDGINVDEETQNLIKFQSAYTAAAKTLSTLNTMMQTTLGLISGG